MFSKSILRIRSVQRLKTKMVALLRRLKNKLLNKMKKSYSRVNPQNLTNL